MRITADRSRYTASLFLERDTYKVAVYVGAKVKRGQIYFSVACYYWFRPSASYFLFARAKEKVTKEKARPTSGSGYARLPSLRRCSEGRQDGPSLAQHASFDFLSNVPLRNTCTRPSDGGISTESLGSLFCLDWIFFKSKADALLRRANQYALG